MNGKNTMLATAFALAFIPGIAMAAPARLVLVIGGEAYDGPPKFAVTFDGKPVGEGAVDKAIDTGTDQRFADAADKSQYVESFSFDIPEADFRPTGEIRISLTNEAYGGDGSNRDRNLFVSSVTLNGVEIKAANLATVTKAGLEPNQMVGDYLAINDNTTQAVSLAPEGGWPESAADESAPAAPAPAAKPAEPATRAAETPAEPEAPAPAAKPAAPAEPKAEEAKPAPQPEPEAKPEPAAALEPDEASAPEDKAAEAEAAPAKPAAAQTATCTLEKSFDVTGFGQNSNDLTPATNKQLDAIAEEIGAQTCSITLTGYSDTYGSYATNALFSVERAQNALKYLRDKGIKFEKAEATGVGETTKFGPSARANRRVVIAVTP